MKRSASSEGFINHMPVLQREYKRWPKRWSKVLKALCQVSQSWWSRPRMPNSQPATTRIMRMCFLCRRHNSLTPKPNKKRLRASDTTRVVAKYRGFSPCRSPLNLILWGHAVQTSSNPRVEAEILVSTQRQKT